MLGNLLFLLIAQIGALTSDKDFRGVQPPDWVLDGAVKVFLPLEDHVGIAEAAATGATIVHAGGPAIYHPLRSQDAKAGIPAAELERLKAGIAIAKSKQMRVVLGVSPYAPIEVVRANPNWMHFGSDNAELTQRAQLDLNLPENIALRSLPLNTPYGDYAIECLAEMMRDLQVDGFSFDGCYHHAINYSRMKKSCIAVKPAAKFRSRSI